MAKIADSSCLVSSSDSCGYGSSCICMMLYPSLHFCLPPLAGDTMNMAARMESTGLKNCIHISGETAELLKAAGKESWIEERKETIDVKGKGSQNTFWVKILNAPQRSNNAGSTHGSSEAGQQTEAPLTSTDNSIRATIPRPTPSGSKTARLVDWNVSILTQRLHAIQCQHQLSGGINPKVIFQLKAHVEGIAHMYRDNPFHNFEVSFRIIASVRKINYKDLTSASSSLSL